MRKCRGWGCFWKEKGLPSVWQSKVVHSKLGVQSNRNCRSHAVSCDTCPLQIIWYQKKIKRCGMVCWRRSKRYLRTEPVITLKQRQHTLYLICNSAGSQWSSQRRGVQGCRLVDMFDDSLWRLWECWQIMPAEEACSTVWWLRERSGGECLFWIGGTG